MHTTGPLFVSRAQKPASTSPSRQESGAAVHDQIACVCPSAIQEQSHPIIRRAQWETYQASCGDVTALDEPQATRRSSRIAAKKEDDPVSESGAQADEELKSGLVGGHGSALENRPGKHDPEVSDGMVGLTMHLFSPDRREAQGAAAPLLSGGTTERSSHASVPAEHAPLAEGGAATLLHTPLLETRQAPPPGTVSTAGVVSPLGHGMVLHSMVTGHSARGASRGPAHGWLPAIPGSPAPGMPMQLGVIQVRKGASDPSRCRRCGEVEGSPKPPVHAIACKLPQMPEELGQAGVAQEDAGGGLIEQQTGWPEGGMGTTGRQLAALVQGNSAAVTAPLDTAGRPVRGSIDTQDSLVTRRTSAGPGPGTTQARPLLRKGAEPLTDEDDAWSPGGFKVMDGPGLLSSLPEADLGGALDSFGENSPLFGDVGQASAHGRSTG